MEVEVTVLGSRPSLVVCTVSVDVKQHLKKRRQQLRALEVYESRGSRPGLPVPNSPYGLCGRKATFEEEEEDSSLESRSCVKVEVTVMGSPSLVVLVVPVDVNYIELEQTQSSGAV